MFVGTFIYFFWQLYSKSKGEEILVLNFAIGWVALYCLVREGYLDLAWAYVFLLPLLVILGIFFLGCKTLLSMHALKKKSMYVYSSYPLRFIFASIIVTFIILSLLVQISDIYLPHFVKPYLYSSAVCLQAVVALGYAIFL